MTALDGKGSVPIEFRSEVDNREDVGRGAPSSTPGGGGEIFIAGEPIGGEDPREKRWRASVCRAAGGLGPGREVTLRFTLSPGREVDLDNLVRVAVAGLRDAGVFRHGFTDLEHLVALKSFSGPIGLGIRLAAAPLPETGSGGLVASYTIPPSDPTTTWKRAWTAEVSRAWAGKPLARPSAVAIEVGSRRSLPGLMKPIIDGLQPYLGRDPRGRYEFCPNDHLIEQLALRRGGGGGTLQLRAWPTLLDPG